MRHRVAGRSLNADTQHRLAMRRNLSRSLFLHGRIVTTPAKAKATRRFAEKLAMPISALDLSIRASNSLEAEGIQTVGELISRTEEELVKLKNFGRTSLKEVEKKLEALGLSIVKGGAATPGA